MKSIQKLLTIGIFLWASLTSISYGAAGDQFYFAGMNAPRASLSSVGANPESVYLRWDVVEGKIPADVTEFILYRNGNKIADFPATQTMNADEIGELYIGDDQDRRKRETIAWLDAEMMNSPSPHHVDNNNFALEIYNHLRSKDAPMWGMLASRNDFNIALARYRGYIDKTAVSGTTYTYELKAGNGSNEVLIGKITLTAGSSDIIDRASDFAQVGHISRCDAPELYKEHATLYLNWSNPGSNSVGKYANALLISGYDLYRTKTETLPGYAVDMRSIAANSGYDATGNIVLPTELEKVNNQPIYISAKAEKEERYKGWNPPFSQYMELPETLEKASIKAGDQRYYFLVARDITGNYGLTQQLQVTIPDLTPPPAPWNIWTTRYSADNSFKILWTDVNLANYYASHKRGRKYCNLSTARLDKKLKFVAQNGSCENNKTQEISLDIGSYIVYRFDSVEDAKLFKDSDGDGYSDADEELHPDPSNTLLTLPGSACEYNATINGLTNYKIATVTPTPSRVVNAKAIIEFADAEPANYKNKFFWYRIATKSKSGQISDLSEPVRAFFPKHELPSRPQIGMGRRMCSYFIDQKDTGSLPLFIDSTFDAAYGALGCETNEEDNIIMTSLAYDPAYKWGDLKRGQCDIVERLNITCREKDEGEPVVRFYNNKGELLKQQVINPALSCDIEDNKVHQDFNLTKTCRTSLESFNDGEQIDGQVYIDPTGITDCIKIGYRVDGAYYLEKTVCPPYTGLIGLAPPDIGGGEVCYSVTLQNSNAETSSAYRLPCFMIPIKKGVLKPLAVDINIFSSSSEADLTWAPPQQEIVGTMLEWYKKGVDIKNNGYHTVLVPPTDTLSPTNTQTLKVELTPEPSGSSWEEQWCFKARTLGKTGGGDPAEAYSEWSDEVCAMRRPAAVPPPQYIPWPKIPLPPKNEELEGMYLMFDGLPVIALSDPIDITGNGCGDGFLPMCDEYRQNSCFVDGDLSVDCDLCSLVEHSVVGKLHFIAYRQESIEPTHSDASEFYQVSPLIPKAYCHEHNNIDDPFVRMLHIVKESGTYYKMFFIDRFPHKEKQYYRYQFVYFDTKGEITGYRQSNWLFAQ
jgi:hypothetical protein